MIQAVLVAAALLAAIIYSLWRIRLLLRRKPDLCHGCDGCALKNQVCDKKTRKKFGCSK
jgi:hypothetical protein